MPQEQRRVLFSGDVQGVGFRYTACRTADDFGVAGYVRNLPDGDVECVVEGDAAAIDGFIDDLSTRMSNFVRQVKQQKAPFTGTYRSFGVRY